jgi:hypothetical protein
MAPRSSKYGFIVYHVRQDVAASNRIEDCTQAEGMIYHIDIPKRP